MNVSEILRAKNITINVSVSYVHDGFETNMVGKVDGFARIGHNKAVNNPHYGDKQIVIPCKGLHWNTTKYGGVDKWFASNPMYIDIEQGESVGLLDFAIIIEQDGINAPIYRFDSSGRHQTIRRRAEQLHNKLNEQILKLLLEEE